MSALRRTAPMILAAAVTGLAFAAAAPAETTSPTHAPAVGTGVAHLLGTTATLDGTINPHGLPTTYYFEYGPKTTYGSQTEHKVLTASTATEKVHLTATNFHVEYHYRLVASNEKGTRDGKDREYTGETTATSKSKKSGFVLPSTFQPTLVGEGFTFSGTLAGAGDAGRLVVLQASPYPYTAAFTNVAGPIPTTVSGSFSLHVAALSESTRYRAATVTAPVIFSESVTELADVHVTLKVQTNKHVKGLVRLYGTVSPAASGAAVFFQIEKARKPAPTKAEKPERPNRSERAEEAEEKPTFDTRFKTVVKHATRRFSRFSLVVKVREGGAYRAFIQMPPGPYASGGSTTISLDGSAAKKKAKKK